MKPEPHIPCGCTECEPVHGDQAPDPLELENDRLKARVRDLEAAAKAVDEALGYRPPSQTVLERIAELREDADCWEGHFCAPWDGP